MKIYVGNMSFDTTKEDLQRLFEVHGNVTGVSLVEDQYTGKPRGFAFVEMATKEEASAAILALNEKNVNGRPLTVNEARPRTNDGGGGRNFGGGGGGGRNYGGGNNRSRSNGNRYR